MTEGAAPIKSSSGVVKIPLMDEAVLLPRGKRLVVSSVGVRGQRVPRRRPDLREPGGREPRSRSAASTLKLSFLKRAVSK